MMTSSFRYLDTTINNRVLPARKDDMRNPNLAGAGKEQRGKAKEEERSERASETTHKKARK
jgi:hypothetical protein